MADTLKPSTPDQLKEAIAWACAEQTPVEVRGHGTKTGIGHEVQAAWTLDVTGLSGITLYEPEELVLVARAGTPLDEIVAVAAGHGQELAFEPPDLSRLLGTSGRGTFGGMIAAGLSGSRRIKAGAVRDHFLGFNAISGRGESFKSGGRVMKNVTGYDLPKLIAGSWGTLAVMFDATVKVLPRAETQATLVLWGLDDAMAAKAMSRAMQSSCEVSGAAHLPAGIVSREPFRPLAQTDVTATLLRLEGFGPSVAYRGDVLEKLLADGACATTRLDAEPSAAVWQAIRDVHAFAGDPVRAVWRLSVPPAAGPAVVESVAATGDCEAYYDWAGGLVWLSLAPAADDRSAVIRAAITPYGGHATLIRGHPGIAGEGARFEPLDVGTDGLVRRIKAGFDPHGILNPGRMYAGI